MVIALMKTRVTSVHEGIPSERFMVPELSVVIEAFEWVSAFTFSHHSVYTALLHVDT